MRGRKHGEPGGAAPTDPAPAPPHQAGSGTSAVCAGDLESSRSAFSSRSDHCFRFLRAFWTTGVYLEEAQQKVVEPDHRELQGRGGPRGVLHVLRLRPLCVFSAHLAGGDGGDAELRGCRALVVMPVAPYLIGSFLASMTYGIQGCPYGRRGAGHGCHGPARVARHPGADARPCILPDARIGRRFAIGPPAGSAERRRSTIRPPPVAPAQAPRRGPEPRCRARRRAGCRWRPCR